MSTKEKQAIEYRQKLVEQWSTSKEVRKVADRRHLPASVHNAVKLKREMIEAAKVKEDRRRKHSRKGKEKPKAERKSECSGHWGIESVWSVLGAVGRLASLHRCLLPHLSKAYWLFPAPRPGTPR